MRNIIHIVNTKDPSTLALALCRKPNLLFGMKLAETEAEEYIVHFSVDYSILREYPIIPSYEKLCEKCKNHYLYGMMVLGALE